MVNKVSILARLWFAAGSSVSVKTRPQTKVLTIVYCLNCEAREIACLLEAGLVVAKLEVEVRAIGDVNHIVADGLEPAQEVSDLHIMGWVK